MIPPSITLPSRRTEVLAGISTFLATMYIIIVNPAILSQAGLPFSGVLTATILLSFFCSLMMGLYARNPIVVAPGMGLNAFFTFTAVKGLGITPGVALGAVFWAGVLFLLLSVLNVRSAIVRIIPLPLRYAVSAGIGLFITLIGFENAKFIVSNPATLVGVAHLSDPIILTFVAGLLLTAVLVVRNVPGAIIIGIVLTTLAAWPIGRYWGDASAVNFGQKTLVNFQGFVAAPDFSLHRQTGPDRVAEVGVVAGHIRVCVHRFVRQPQHVRGRGRSGQPANARRGAAQPEPLAPDRCCRYDAGRIARHQPRHGLHRVGGGDCAGWPNGTNGYCGGLLFPAISVPVALVIGHSGYCYGPRAGVGGGVHDEARYAHQLEPVRRCPARVSGPRADSVQLLHHAGANLGLPVVDGHQSGRWQRPRGATRTLDRRCILCAGVVCGTLTGETAIFGL